MSLLSRSLKLSSGASFPQLGFGTWNLHGKDIEPAMLAALDAGYRHFDFAMIYENEKEIGRVLHTWMANHPSLRRDDFFFTSKLWNTDHRQVRSALLQTLQDLQLAYVDLYLIHWPLPQLSHGLVDTQRTLVDTWRDMIQLQQEGLVKHVGVSNFTQEHLSPLLHEAVVPEVNQIEIHPLLPQTSLIDFCHQHHIVVTAYCPLGSAHSPLFADPTLNDMAQRYQGTPAQVLLSWGVDRGYAVIPKSAHPERIQANTRYLALREEDKKRIAELVETYGPQRMCDPRDFYGVDLFHEGNRTLSK